MNDQAEAAAKSDYSQTLFLPQTEFPMRGGLPQREPEWLKRWEEMGLYQLQRQQAEQRPQFTLHDGPPYANGNIHIGHALNKILKDFVTRSWQMLGYNAAYVPGWDCHGLPIEWKIEEQYREKGRDKNAVEINEFRAECRAFAQHWVDVQRDEFKRLGVGGDWDNPYLTMSFDAEAQIARELMKFATSGQLYRGSKPVMWSVVERTALAEAEIEYQDYESDAIWVKFPIHEIDRDQIAEMADHSYVRSAPKILKDSMGRSPGVTPDTSFADHLVAKLSDPSLFDGAFVVIWTTTPWTIPGNRAISYSSRIGYGLYQVTATENDFGPKVGEKLIFADSLAEECAAKAKLTFQRLADVSPDDLGSMSCSHPLKGLAGGYEFAVPLLDGEHVTNDTGTGFVHTAPGHGLDDFEIWMNSGRMLTSRRIDTTIPATVDDAGFYTKDAPGFEGARVIDDKGNKGDANKRVIEALIEKNMLFARGRLKHQYPHSWRSKKPIIFRNTPQWFVYMDHDIEGQGDTLRHRALAAIDATQFVPPAGQNRLRSMIAERPDWVLSRQRAWGVPIAVFVKKGSNEVLRDEAVNRRIADAFEIEGADAWFKPDAKARFLGSDYSPEDYDKVDDILDVWFESGTTHAWVLENKAKWSHLNTPADLYLEGSDQHRGWFHSSLLESCATRGHAPYKAVLTHGFTLDGEGRKMSKSLGNVVAPQKLIEQYGADILRLWVASSDYSDDLRIGDEIIKTNVESYRKIRNTLRWLLGNLAHYHPEDEVAFTDMPELERLILDRLQRLDGEVRAAYKAYDYKRVVSHVSNFMINDLSAFYFDVRKDALYCDPISSVRRKAALTVLDRVFECVTVWLAPILCFTMEEVWLSRNSGAESSVHLRIFPDLPTSWRDDALAAKWRQIRTVRRVVTGALEIERREKRIGSSLEAAPKVFVTDAGLLGALHGEDMAEISITSGIEIVEAEGPPEAFRLEDVAGVSVVFQPAKGTRCARSWRILEEVGSDKDYPDLSLRDAAAMREFEAAGATA